MSGSQNQREARDRIGGYLSWKILPVVGLTAALLVGLVHHLSDGREMMVAVSQARWGWAPVVAALLAMNLVCNGWRFQLVLRAAGYRVSLRRALSVILSVWPLVLVIPARINDLLRAWALADEVPKADCLGSVVAERFVDVQTLCLLGVVGGLWMGLWPVVGLMGALWLGAWTVLVATLRGVDWVVTWPVVKRKEETLRRLMVGFEGLVARPWMLGAVMGASALAWLVAMGNLWVLSQVFGAGLEAQVILGLWPIALFGGMIPLTMGGMGTRDGIFVALLALAGVGVSSESALLATTFGYGVILVMTPGVLGIPWMVKWLLRGEEGDEA